MALRLPLALATLLVLSPCLFGYAQPVDDAAKVTVGISGGAAGLIGDYGNVSDALSAPAFDASADVFLKIGLRTSVGILARTAQFEDVDPRELALGLGLRTTGYSSTISPYAQASVEVVNPALDRRGFAARLAGGAEWTGAGTVYPYVEVGLLASFNDETLGALEGDSQIDWLPTAALGIRIPLLKPKPSVEIGALVHPDTLLVEQSFRYSIAVAQKLNPIVTYTWDMGDGSTYHEQNAVHSYRDPGTYNGSVAIKANDDPEVVRVFTVHVLDNYTAARTGRPARVEVKLQKLFGRRQLVVGQEENYRVSLVDDRARPVRFIWDMGDGTFAPGNNVVHSYDAPGLYEAKVVATAPAGSDSLLFNIEVVEPEAPAVITDENVVVVQPSDRNPNIRPAPEVPTYEEADGTRYAWITDTFLDRTAAERAMKKYPLAGLVPRIMEDTGGSGATAYRILIGDYDSVRAAMNAKAKVERVASRNIFLYSY